MVRSLPLLIANARLRCTGDGRFACSGYRIVPCFLGKVWHDEGMSEITSGEECTAACCAGKANTYREYEIRVKIKVHDSLPRTQDYSLVEETKKEIADLVCGDLVIIKIDDAIWMRGQRVS